MLFSWLKEWFGTYHAFKIFAKIHLNRIDSFTLPSYKNRIKLRRNTSDIDTFLQVIVYREYDINFQFEPAVIIDGGANIGLFSVFMKHKFPDAKIISVEPDEENFQLLKENIAGYKDIFCEQAGLWHKQSNIVVHDKHNLGKWGFVVEETSDDSKLKSLTINNLMERHSLDRIDLLKLDIETSEKELFSDNYQTWLPKTKMIVIELHDKLKKGCSHAFFSAVNESIKDYSYSIRGESTIIINHDID